MWPTIFELKLPFWPHELTIRSYGLMLMIGFLGGTWWAARRAERVKANPELVVNMGFVALLSSIIGARVFYVIHYWDEHFAGRGFWAVVNITAGGLEFYGGFIGALAALILYLRRARVSLRLYLDIIAPSIAFGLAVTRIGCFLNGCCWGGPCPAQVPWSVRFPYQSPAFERQWQQRLTALPAPLIGVHEIDGLGYRVDPFSDEKQTGLALHAAKFGLTRDDLARMARAVEPTALTLHPVQLYASLDAGLLAILLNTVFYRRKRHGILAALFLILYPIMRIFEEIIRMDNPHDTAGLTISQFVSVVLLAIGLATWLVLRKLPVRSPLAVPYRPPAERALSGPEPTASGKPKPPHAAGARKRAGKS
ncbi:MAG: prolipoprotein diacylglyceryl transferase [Phycisphaerae bacterium]